MKKLIAISIASASIAIGAIPAFAEVDSKIHNLCIEAKDYAGCVRAMKGETMPTSRVINSQGADIAEGNACPSGFAYIGGGNCQEVKCGDSIYGNDERLGGKFWSCKKHLFGRNSLYLGEKIVRTSTLHQCPPGEPGIGFNNSCESTIKTVGYLERVSIGVTYGNNGIITSVFDSAKEAGILKGDRIISMGGHSVSELFASSSRSYDAGDSVIVVVERNSARKTFSVTAKKHKVSEEQLFGKKK